jgi:1-deoxy-D-xylulose-5-phosphate synthase
MAHWMLAYDRGPTAVRYPRGSGDDRLPDSRSPIQLGKAEILRLPEHAKVAIVAIGSTVSPAYEAAQTLSQQGVECTVVNARFIKPLDAEAMVSVAERCGAVLTVEENVRSGGFGEQVRNVLADAGLGHLPMRLLALPDEFVEHGAQPILRSYAGIDAESIAAAALELAAISQPSKRPM